MRKRVITILGPIKPLNNLQNIAEKGKEIMSDNFMGSYSYRIIRIIKLLIG